MRPPTKEETRGAYVVYPWLIKSHVPGYGVRAFPAHRRRGGQVLVPVAPRLTQSAPSGEGDRSEAPTPGPSHPLQPVQAATPYVSGGRPGRTGYIATGARDGDASTLMSLKSACGGSVDAEKETHNMGRALPGSPPLFLVISSGGCWKRERLTHGLRDPC